MAGKKRDKSEDADVSRTPGDREEPLIIVPGGDVDDIEILRRERDEYLEAARRARADYVNLQRRMDSQFSAARQDARASMALDVLTILDDLERALEHGRQGEDYDGLLEGVALVRDKFVSMLDRYEIKRIDALGESFDHNFHDAIAEQPTDQADPGTVVAVAMTGYMIGGRLLRPARVVVARPLDSGRDDKDARRDEAGREHRDAGEEFA